MVMNLVVSAFAGAALFHGIGPHQGFAFLRGPKLGIEVDARRQPPLVVPQSGVESYRLCIFFQ